jgi:exodeoxyribonuclease-3
MGRYPQQIPIHEDDRLDWQAMASAPPWRQARLRHPNRECLCACRRRYPDREANPKFGQKLDFLERMTRWSEECRVPTVLVGDFNVAPLECDVWSHKQLLNVVSHTPIEVERLTQLQQSGDWVDLGRHFHPAPGRLFTWWSYRSPDFSKNDRGRRLDHMWATRDVAALATNHHVYEPCRAWPRPFRSRAARHRVRRLKTGRDVARASMRCGVRLAVGDHGNQRPCSSRRR